MRTVTNIPVSLCEYALVNRKVNQLKLYIYLKLKCRGYIKFDKADMKQCSETIGVDLKTVKSSLQWLVKNKWVTINSKRQVLNIISYNRLKNKLKIRLQKGVLVELESKEDYKSFEALCCAIVITHYVKGKHYFDRQSERKKGRSNTNCNKMKGFHPMPNAYLAKCLNVSVPTAYRIKQRAEDAGYIETKSNRVFIERNDGSRIEKEHFEMLKTTALEEGCPNIFREGRKYIKIISADLIRSSIRLKRKRFV